MGIRDLYKRPRIGAKSGDALELPYFDGQFDAVYMSFTLELLDCRPIYVEKELKNAQFKIKKKEHISIFGLGGEIVIGVKEE